MDQIRKLFEKNFELSDQEWQVFSSKLVKRNFPKKHLLLKAGGVENHLSFIERGVVRFFLRREQNDLTFSFAFSNDFVSGYSSFLTRKPSVFYMETLTPTTLWQLTYEDLQEIYRNTKTGNAIGRHASEELFLKKFERELSLLEKTAEQRYLNLFTEQPELLREIPLKYIASYIGVTPQALSRIRKRIT